MLPRYTVFSLLLMIVLTLQPIKVYSQSDIIKSLDERHTVGFPGYLNITSIEDLLKIISPYGDNDLDRMLKCNTLECLSNDLLSNSIIGAILSNTTGIDIRNITRIDERSLLDMVDNPDIRELLENLNSKKVVEPSTLNNALNTVEDARRSGSLSSQAYLAALEIIKRIVERGGGEASAIERMQVNAVKDAILEASKRGLLADLINKLGSLYAESQAWSSNINSAQRSFNIKRPEVTFSMPSISLEIMVLALLAIFAILALLNIHRIEALIRGLGWKGYKLEGLEDLSNLPLVPRLYWSSIRVIERLAGVRMGVSTTHREYLNLISPKLGNLAEPLEGLTESYELYRFAGLRDSIVEEKALKSYEKLLRHWRSEGP